jgi:tetratricopeptide (TPR) repeat protein
MKRCAALALALASLWGGAVRADSKPDADKPEDFVETRLSSGLSAGFGLLRLGGDAPQESLALGGHVFSAPSNTVARMLLDEKSGAAFGYRLEAAALSSTLFGVVRIDIRPLAPEDEKQLKRLPACAGCPSPEIVASDRIRFPPTQVIRDGDTMVIDLLVRPETGERLVDVVKFSADAVTREVLDKVRARITQAFQYTRQADVLLERGALEAAAAEYAKALALRPEAAGHVRLGVCYQRLERLEPAEQQFDKAARLNPGDAEAWHGLATLQHRRGQFGKAVDGYTRALKLRPDWALARRNLATARLDRAELEAAYADYRQAYRSSPAALDACEGQCVKGHDAGLQQFLFARVYAAAGQSERALAALAKAKASGFTDLDRVKEDPEFGPLLNDPRLVALLAREPRS